MSGGKLDTSTEATDRRAWQASRAWRKFRVFRSDRGMDGLENHYGVVGEEKNHFL
jgi:hypothetical protein